jgi:hypothetical protein
LNILHVGRGEGCFYYVMELADDAGDVSEKAGEPVSEKQPGRSSYSPAQSLTRSPDSYVPRTLKLDLKRRGRLPPAEFSPSLWIGSIESHAAALRVPLSCLFQSSRGNPPEAPVSFKENENEKI